METRLCSSHSVAPLLVGASVCSLVSGVQVAAWCTPGLPGGSEHRAMPRGPLGVLVSLLPWVAWFSLRHPWVLGNVNMCHT